MSTRIHINDHIVKAVTAEANPHVPELISLQVTEEGAGGHLVDFTISMHRDLWQMAVDRLADHSIVAGVTLARLAANQ